MKKLYIIFLMFLFVLSSTSCSKGEFTISSLDLNFNKIEVLEGSSGNNVLLDEEETEEFYQSFMNVTLKDGKTDDTIADWSYSIVFMENDKKIEELKIIDENTIQYKDKIYSYQSSDTLAKNLKQLFHPTFQAVVSDIAPSLIVKPDNNTIEAKTSDRIVLNTNNIIFYDTKGQPMELDEIQVGDLVEITYDGTIMESYPAQISASEIKVMENLLVNGYLAIIDDIFNEDPGLNSDIEIIALDPNGITNLSDLEKTSVILKMEIKYGLEIREGTFDELAKEGFIDKEKLFFEKGILIKIKNLKFNEDKKTITYGIEKWRSGLGTFGSDDATAKYKEGTWEITKRGFYIS